MDVNPQDIRYFLEIAQTQNLSHAAVRLGVSQPSLTVAIHRLEQSLKAQLLIRSRRGVQLTPAGRHLIAHSRKFLEMWEELKSETGDAQNEVRGHFTLGCHSSVGLYALPEVLARAMSEHSELHIELRHDLSRKILEAVANVRIDLGVVINPVRHPDLILKKLGEDQVAFWARPGISEKLQKTLICDPDLVQSQDLIKQAKKKGFHFERYLPTSSLELVSEMARAGAGVGIIPGRVAARHSAKQLVPLKNSPVFRDEIFIAHRVENRQVKSIQTLVELISQHFARTAAKIDS
jgi:DNA-binding transcriptional LysR family regulator